MVTWGTGMSKRAKRRKGAATPRNTDGRAHWNWRRSGRRRGIRLAGAPGERANRRKAARTPDPGAGVVDPGLRGASCASQRRLRIGSAPAAAPLVEPPKAAAEGPGALVRQVVDYASRQTPGTVIIDTGNTFLYYVLNDRQAMRYGIGVGPRRLYMVR